MNTGHVSPSMLAAYGVDPSGVDTLVSEPIEDHLLACDRCRRALTDSTPASDLERSWRRIVAELGFDQVGDPRPMPEASAANRRSPVARSVLVAACVALVVVAAVLVSARREPAAPATTELPAGFVDLGSIDGLAVGEVRWFEAHQLFLVRTDAEFLALSQRSPHRGCRLVTVDQLVAAQPEMDVAFLGPDVVFHDPCHGSNFRLDGSKVGGPSARDMYRYRVDTFTGRVVVDVRLAIPGSFTGRDPGSEPMPSAGSGVIDEVSNGWLRAAEAAVEGIRDVNSGPLLWPLGAFHDPASGLVSLPLTVGYEFGVLEIGDFEVMHRWDYDALDVIVPGQQTSVGVMNVYRSRSDERIVHVELTLPDDTGVRLSLGYQPVDSEVAVDVLLGIVGAHELDG